MKRMIAAILVLCMVLCMVLCSIPVAAAASFDEFFADVPATVENDASYPFAESDDETCLISGNKGMGGNDFRPQADLPERRYVPLLL